MKPKEATETELQGVVLLWQQVLESSGPIEDGEPHRASATISVIRQKLGVDGLVRATALLIQGAPSAVAAKGLTLVACGHSYALLDGGHKPARLAALGLQRSEPEIRWASTLLLEWIGCSLDVDLLVPKDTDTSENVQFMKETASVLLKRGPVLY